VTDTAAVLAALDAVRDPELDEPVTSLGFVASCTVSADGMVDVHLRLPTYFCAPNFAFLMVADAHDAVSRLEGVRHTVIVLEDHFASTPSTAASPRAPASSTPSASWRRPSSTTCGRCSSARPCWPARTSSAARCSLRGAPPRS
jgi:metal-sulfur cluster biosynthetic enzyme